MTDLILSPSRLSGSIRLPSSKSMAQRLLVCAALADTPTELELFGVSEDISVFIEALSAIGAKILSKTNVISITNVKETPEKCTIDCRESGACMRFMLPIAAALGINAEIKGAPRLSERPVFPLTKALREHGVFVLGDKLPVEISGRMTGGHFTLPGDVSSQFVSGILLSLPLIGGGITLSTKLVSQSYVEMTKRAMRIFSVNADALSTEKCRYISPGRIVCEEDVSLAAIWQCANTLGAEITLSSCDEALKSLLEDFPQEVDVSDMPDAAPLLAVVGAQKGGVRLSGCARLSHKESDRASGTAGLINSLGGKAEYSDGIITVFPQKLTGGRADTQNDHRLVFAAAVASTVCEKSVYIINSDAVRKSYPGFFEDFISLGGEALEYKD